MSSKTQSSAEIRSIEQQVTQYAEEFVPSARELDKEDDLPDYNKVYSVFGGLKGLSEATGLEYNAEVREFPY